MISVVCVSQDAYTEQLSLGIEKKLLDRCKLVSMLNAPCGVSKNETNLK